MKIRRIVSGCVAISVLMAGNAFGQAKDGVGVGIMIGEPTGLSLKKWVDTTRAIDAGIAWSFSDNASLHFHGDYLFHRFDILSVPELRGVLPVHFGLGFRLKLKEDNRGRGRNDDDVMVGIRVPFGVSYLFADAPADIFAEIVPILDVAPKTDFRLNAAIGARYYFGKR